MGVTSHLYRSVERSSTLEGAAMPFSNPTLLISRSVRIAPLPVNKYHNDLYACNQQGRMGVRSPVDRLLRRIRKNGGLIRLAVNCL